MITVSLMTSDTCFTSIFSFGNRKHAVDTENMNPEFLTLRFRNFEFLIHNSYNSKVLYSKTEDRSLIFKNKSKKSEFKIPKEILD